MDDLQKIVHALLDPDDRITEAQLGKLVEDFLDNIVHPGGTDLIYYPENWGLSSDPTADQIVSVALSWQPRILAMRVTAKRDHPSRSDLSCYIVESEGIKDLQVIAKKELAVGQMAAVALSGTKLPNGVVLTHRFIDGAYSAGEILGPTSEPCGTVLQGVAYSLDGIPTQ